jgi:hypothetical protein
VGFVPRAGLSWQSCSPYYYVRLRAGRARFHLTSEVQDGLRNVFRIDMVLAVLHLLA